MKTNVSPDAVHQIFGATAARFPDRVAIDLPPNPPHRPRRFLQTYRELDGLSDRVAAWLSPFAARDTVVSILLARSSPELYAAQLGVLKSGAAFSCLDPSYPDDHLLQVFADVDAIALLTDDAGRERIERLGVSMPVCGALGDLPEPLARASPVVPSDAGDLAYVIYTSGTTGRPKGVLIEHRGIANLVRANVDYFALTERDRVAQCSSPAYDSALEEMWLAFAVGAALVPLDDETVRLGPGLVDWLRDEGVTVLCPPPTLLRSMGEANPRTALPNLRLLYVGGEPLPPDLADRWAAGRRLENGYGPTECTVTAVRGRIFPGRPVTIGTPVPGHRAFALDDDQREVPDGETGELCLAGVGLARGYHRLPGVTAEKFLDHPNLGRIYRTGDAVRKTPSGEWEHLGRLDGQVKLRGYRVELGAVEALLSQCGGVRAAVCRLQGDAANPILTAHLVPNRLDRLPSFDEIRSILGRSLPPFMVPSRFGLIERVPTRVGGKVNRDDLPWLDGTGLARSRPYVAPVGARESAVVEAFAKALQSVEPVSTGDDFFRDLGGNSLSAVSALAELHRAGYGRVSVRDLYESRTPATLAAKLDVDRPTGRESEPEPEPASPTACTLIQGSVLLAELILGSAVAYWLVFELFAGAVGGLDSITLLIASSVGGWLAILLHAAGAVGATVLAKRILVGRYRPGHFPIWGGFYTRNWIVCHCARLIPWSLIADTVFVPGVLRLLGASVGRRVLICDGVDLASGGWDLLTLCDGATVGQDARISPLEWDRGRVVCGSITVGESATLGTRSGISPGGTLGRDCTLTALSWLPAGVASTEGQAYDGIPAVPVGAIPDRPFAVPELHPILHGGLLVAGRSLRSVSLYLAGFAAILLLGEATDRESRSWADVFHEPELSASNAVLLLGIPAVGTPVVLILLGVAMRLLGRTRPGIVSAWSWHAIRIGLKIRIVQTASDWLTGSLLWPRWLRLAGMRVGRGCEISTIIGALPEPLTLGDGCFLTDGVYVGGLSFQRGTLTVAETKLGANTFVGNQSVIATGHDWPTGLFLGVSTVADPVRMPANTAWFGQPPMELPRRELAVADRSTTHAPGVRRIAVRLFWELLRFALPSVTVAIGYGWYWCLASSSGGTPATTFLVAPAASFAAAFLGVALGLGIKWVLLGRVKPGRHPLWSSWSSRWDFMYVAWGYLAQRHVGTLQGTLFLNAVLRLTGMKIGRRVALGPGSSHVVDPDMIAIDDFATMSGDIQAHTFEDRVLKIDRVRIGRSATVGAHAVVLLGAKIGERAWVSPHSVVMKREELAPGMRYTGSPTILMDDANN